MEFIINNYEAIILTVSHDKYKDLNLTNKNQIVYDVKSILKNMNLLNRYFD